MATMHFYLLFDGNCEEAFTFYRTVFEGEFLALIRYDDVKKDEALLPVSDGIKNKIEHISLSIGQGAILMGTDAKAEMAEKIVLGNNFSIYMEAENKQETEYLFHGLSEGGNVLMPLAVAHWGDYFTMFTDQFGINWFLNCKSDKYQ